MPTSHYYGPGGTKIGSSSLKGRLKSIGSVVGIIVFLLALLAFVQWVGWYVFIDILVAIATFTIIYVGWVTDRDSGKKHNWFRDFVALAIVAACLCVGELIVASF